MLNAVPQYDDSDFNLYGRDNALSTMAKYIYVTSRELHGCVKRSLLAALMPIETTLNAVLDRYVSVCMHRQLMVIYVIITQLTE